MARKKAAPATVPAPSQVQVVPIGDLSPDPANLRLHDARNKSGLAASVKRFGPARSIVIDGRNVVHAGNGTLEAAQASGVTEVLVIDPKPNQLVAVRRADWTESEATAYGIADNRSAEVGSTWDHEGLAQQLRAFQEQAVPVADLGWDPLELQALLASTQSPDPIETSSASIVTTLPELSRTTIHQITFTYSLADEPAIREFVEQEDDGPLSPGVGKMILGRIKDLAADRTDHEGSGGETPE